MTRAHPTSPRPATHSRCPRCARESLVPAAYCVGCGAPLRLADDAPPAALDVLVDLDRRAGEHGHGGAAPRGGGAEADDLAAVERSHWDLRSLLAGGPEPSPEGVASPIPAASPEPRVMGGAEALPDPDVDALEVHVERAPSWRRAAAWAVDAIPFLAAGGALGRSLLRAAAPGVPAPAEDLSGLLELAAREQGILLSLWAAVAIALAVYATLAHLLAGATLGKWLLRLRVVGPDGARPSPARSAVRSALALVSAALLGLGFVLALFTRSGRALHDLGARTWVVKAP